MAQPNQLRENFLVLSFSVRWTKMCEKNNVHKRIKTGANIRINQGFILKNHHSDEKKQIWYSFCSERMLSSSPIFSWRMITSAKSTEQIPASPSNKFEGATLSQGGYRRPILRARWVYRVSCDLTDCFVGQMTSSQ